MLVAKIFFFGGGRGSANREIVHDSSNSKNNDNDNDSDDVSYICEPEE